MIGTKKLKNSFKNFNRAENLVLEVIILATRFKVAKENKNEIIYSKISEKIQTYIELIENLSNNEQILKTIKRVKKFVDSI